jgi:putative thioredoxin
MQPRNMSMSGVVDLAAVKAAQEAKAKAEQARAEAARQGGGPGAVSPADLVIDVDEAGFERDVLQRSTEVPVVIDFWAEWCEPCKQLSPLLEQLVVEYNGRLLLAKIDVDANQMLMQQFGVQGIPAVFAVVAGQALPLFQGAAGKEQIQQTLDQLVQVAEQRFGLSTRMPSRAPPRSPRPSPRDRTTHSSKPPYAPWTQGTSAVPSRRTRTY